MRNSHSSSLNPTRQQTLSAPCRILGRGYWTGKQTCVTVEPADIDQGISFRRSDLNRQYVDANVDNRDDAALRTNLRVPGGRIEMIEHLMSALVGLGITNANVTVDSEELPALDGSSLGYANRIASTGISVQGASPNVLQIDHSFRVGTDSAWVEFHPSENEGTTYRYQLDYGTQSDVPQGVFDFDPTEMNYLTDIAPARTFVTLDQADAIRSRGIASHVTNEDLLVIGPNGPVGNRYRFNDECARHKTLDLIGDLALAGVHFQGQVVSHRGGHSLNAQAATKLRELAFESGILPLRKHDMSHPAKNRRAA